MDLKKHENNVEINTQQKTNLIQKDGGEERQEEQGSSEGVCRGFRKPISEKKLKIFTFI